MIVSCDKVFLHNLIFEKKMNKIKNTSILAMFILCMFEHKAALIYF